MKKSAPLLLLAALALAACGRGSDRAARVVVIGETAPALGAPGRAPPDAASAVLRGAIAQGLVSLDGGGQIVPGLAESWNVSNDGLSYIFRLSLGEWPDGRRIRADDVARMIERMRAQPRDDAVLGALGAIREVVAMTDRVIEIRLAAPRPNLLFLLAQPELSLIRGEAGSGPFRVARRDEGALRLERRLPGVDGDEGEREAVALAAEPAPRAVAAFIDGKADLVLGGRFLDLPLATRANLPRGALRFDPAIGLFGLVPMRKDGLVGDLAVRQMLSQAIDRDALIAALGVPGLAPRATILEAGLGGMPEPSQPGWLGEPLADRRTRLVPLARARFAGLDAAKRTLRVALPEGPGADLLLERLQADWGVLGLKVERARRGADLALIDAVAPSDSPGWYLRRLRCGTAAICVTPFDTLVDGARATVDPAQRAALFGQAAAMADAQALFVAIMAPVRWSLVSRDLPGFAENRFAVHPLGGLKQKGP